MLRAFEHSFTTWKVSPNGCRPLHDHAAKQAPSLESGRHSSFRSAPNLASGFSPRHHHLGARKTQIRSGIGSSTNRQKIQSSFFGSKLGLLVTSYHIPTQRRWPAHPSSPSRHVADRSAAGAVAGGSVSITVPETDSWDTDTSNWRPVAGIPQDSLVSHREAAGEDSKFLLFRGVDLHYKEAGPHTQSAQDPPPQETTSTASAAQSDPTNDNAVRRNPSLATGAVLLHGFGASSFSWKKMMLPLADSLCGPVIAFDRPGFGFTERVPPPPVASFLEAPASNPYSLAWSADAAVSLGLRVQAETGSKPIMIGHSAGCLVAAQAALDNPNLFSALVLIAPAIIPPFFGKKQNPVDTLATAAGGDTSPATGPVLGLAGAAPVASGGESVGERSRESALFNGSAATRSSEGALFTASLGKTPQGTTPPGTPGAAGDGNNPRPSPSPSKRGPGPLLRPLLLAALFLRLMVMQLANQIARFTRQAAALASAVPVRLAESMPQPEESSGIPAKMWDALGSLCLMLVSSLAFLVVQVVLLVNKIADGVATVASVLGFGWKGASVVLSAAILRNAVAISVLRRAFDGVGIRTVVSAWYARSLCTKDDIAGYTKPLRCRNWDRALLEYVVGAGLNPPVGEKLGDLSCPVLVITGKQDTIVPAWNSKRVAEAIPGAKLVVIDKCGHVPQEEKPEVVLRAIMSFLQETHSLEERN